MRHKSGIIHCLIRQRCSETCSFNYDRQHTKFSFDTPDYSNSAASAASTIETRTWHTLCVFHWAASSSVQHYTQTRTWEACRQPPLQTRTYFTANHTFDKIHWRRCLHSRMTSQIIHSICFYVWLVFLDSIWLLAFPLSHCCLMFFCLSTLKALCIHLAGGATVSQVFVWDFCRMASRCDGYSLMLR